MSDTPCMIGGTKDCRSQYDQWLSANAKAKLTFTKGCLRVAQRALCRSLVGQHSGTPNVYATIQDSGCTDSCTELWDACDLHDPERAKKYQPLHMKCYTPNSTKRSTMRYPADNGPSTSGCWHPDGTVQLPDCELINGFACKNGGKWHPECAGCLCPEGFSGSDCSRCGSENEMWPSVYRKEPNTSVYRPNISAADAACVEILHGSQSRQNASLYNGSCTEFSGFRLSRESATAPMLYDMPLIMSKESPLLTS